MKPVVRWPSLVLTAVLAVAPSLARAETLDVKVPVADEAGFDRALQVARGLRRQHPGATIVIHLPPALSLRSPLSLSAADSGTPGAPLVVQGESRGSVISGAVTLTTGGLNGGDSNAARFPANVKSQIRVADLRAYRKPQDSGFPTVFNGTRRLMPARWPTADYLRQAQTFPGAQPKQIELALNPAAAQALRFEPAADAVGYFGYDWHFEAFRAQLNAGGDRVVLPEPAYGVRPNARYYFRNVAAGLQSPANGYYDVELRRLYLLTDKAADLKLAGAASLIKIAGAHDIVFRGVAVEYAADTAVTVSKGDRILFEDCFVGHTGIAAIMVEQSSAVHIHRCLIEDTGWMAVTLDGGDRVTLTPSGNSLEASVVRNFGATYPAYTPAVRLSGVGNVVRDNDLGNGPHAAIILSGNDNEIAGNRIHDVVLDTGDSGAIYGGRDWTMRGNVIRQNAFYNILPRNGQGLQGDVVGVYLDDELSGTRVEDNLFSRVSLPILIGGGRDNVVAGNLFLASKQAAIFMDQRGLTYQKDMVFGGELVKRLAAVPYQGALYAGRYPGVATTFSLQPGAPLGNRFEGNLYDSDPLASFDMPATESFVTVDMNRKVSFPVSIDNPVGQIGARPDLPAGLGATVRRLQQAAGTLAPIIDRWSAY